ncbi:MAG TPA: M23 family metallopeptidase, partial [Bacteroidales bacterium]|nr:M23 family metallopeptidase [Bacteroidales bacterium]
NDSLNAAFGGDWSNDILFLFNKESDISKMEDSVLVVLKNDKNFFSSPKEGPINSDFGWRRRRFHYGIDIDLNIGDTVKSTFDGIVRVSKWVSGYGNVIIVRHFNGLETLYGHLTCSKVLPNQEVKAGELIGLGGSTGRSTGPHLHYEIRYKGSPLNPNQLINFKTAALVKDSIYLSKKSFKYISDIKKAATTTKYYKVKPGDSLSKIAVKNGTSVSNLCRLNGIKQTSTLAVGRTLRVK